MMMVCRIPFIIIILKSQVVVSASDCSPYLNSPLHLNHVFILHAHEKAAFTGDESTVVAPPTLIKGTSKASLYKHRCCFSHCSGSDASLNKTIG
jgi:hypothetical protein